MKDDQDLIDEDPPESEEDYDGAPLYPWGNHSDWPIEWAEND